MRVSSTLLSIVIASSVYCFVPPQITSTSTIQSDDVIGDFIELTEGDDIYLSCTHPNGDDVEFKFPVLTEYSSFDEADTALRREQKGDEWSSILVIKNAKMTDTGSYACVVRNEKSIAHHVYVFVNGSKLFIPLNAGGYSVDPYSYTVPCKTSRNVPKSSVLLQVNGMDLKDASKKYDPRFGFNVTDKVFGGKLKTQLLFTCTSVETKESIEFFLSPRADSSVQKIEIEWGEITSWTHVGGELAVECILNGMLKDDKFRHKLNISCPRCGTEEVSAQNRMRTKGMANSISIQNVTNEDRGVYKCNWYYENELKKTLEKQIDVSSKKGQIKINEMSPTEVTVHKNDTFSLHVNMSAFPLNLPGFTLKWMRHYIKPPKEDPITETIITDATHQQESKRFENQISETLTVKDAKTNSSGLYVLSIQILDTVKTVEFKVTVLSEVADLQPQIHITSPESYVFFHQTYYPSGSEIGVLCSAEFLPLPSSVRLFYRMVNGSWKQVDSHMMQYLNGTFESALHWDTVINQTTDVKCVAHNGVSKDTLMKIKVADGEPRVSHTVTKSVNATPLEDGKDIYEGDTVVLKCTYPKDSDWNVKWRFNGVNIPSHQLNINTTDVSDTLNANLKMISSSASGDYSCILTNNNEETELKITLQVKKSLKPHHTESDSSTPVELQFDHHARLQCHLTGQPKPQIYWFKDDKPYIQGDLEDHNRTLHIKRVASADKGKFTCRAVNRAGYAEATFHTAVIGDPGTKLTFLTTVLTMLVILILFCMLIFGYVIWRQKKTNAEQRKSLGILYEQLMREHSQPLPSTKEPLDQRVERLPYNREYELDRSSLTIETRLGVGQFGQVQKGVLKKSRVSDQTSEGDMLEVAVKSPLNGKNATHQKMLADELKIMCAIGKHPNVLALVGAVTKNMVNGELYVVVELCERGNLKDFLSKRRSNFINELRPHEVNDDSYLVPDAAKRSRYANEMDTQWSEDAEKERLLPDCSSISTSDLLSFAMQVANGMEYLSGLPCIHRDLAARNVLITSNFICRIADFGMARNQNKNYYRLKNSKNVPVPYRWMSIEAIEQGIFTVESDIWSFGILLYEIFTLSGMPYPTIGNEELLEKLKNGYRNSKPNYCHEEIYNLMLQCWKEKVSERPTFNYCLHLLKNHLELSAPQLLERVEKEIMNEVVRQNNLAKWTKPDVDHREQARNALARQEASRTANGENIYLRSY